MQLFLLFVVIVAVIDVDQIVVTEITFSCYLYFADIVLVVYYYHLSLYIVIVGVVVCAVIKNSETPAHF